MTSKRRPLAGRTVLVVGAGDPVVREAALRLSALGASIVAADPSVGEAMVTAGLAAAAGRVARVVEAAAPPLLGEALLRAASVEGPPTDALVAEATFPSPVAAAAAAADLAALLPAGARVLVWKAPAGVTSDLIARVVEAFLSPSR